jgi:protein tyrosine phosphatase (PTP) superfamily phosphohydrolase (DUF442 family)
MSSIQNAQRSSNHFLPKGNHQTSSPHFGAFPNGSTRSVDTLSLNKANPSPALLQMPPPKMSKLGHWIALLRGTEDRKDHPGASKLDNFAQVDGTVFRGAMPVSAGQIEKLRHAYNVRTIIDLRRTEVTPPQFTEFERSWANHHGIRYVPIPMNSHYPPTEKEIAKLFQAIEETNGNVYIHCKMGIDRTGAMVAAYETKLGHPQREVYARMKKHGYNLLHVISRPAQRNFVNGPELAKRVAAAAALL